jgi:hypothetical protein
VPRKLLIWGAVAFVLFYVFTSPESAAGAVRGMLGSLEGVGNSFAQFLESLFA